MRVLSFLGVAPFLLASTVFAQNLAQNAAVRTKVLQQAAQFPVFFTVTQPAMSALTPANSQKIIPFVHPDSASSAVKAGLRLLPVQRARLQQQLAGMIQEGDFVLSFRPEWDGGGSYPHIQMGISHTGLMYLEGTQLANVDAPMNAEYVGKLNAKHYAETQMLHVVRPKNLNPAQRKNVNSWAALFVKNRASYYPSKISFNSDYAAPKYDGTLNFVKTVASHALGVNAPAISVYCSEFAWAVLALRNCDPVAHKAQFSAPGMPACVSTYMKPLPALGDFAQTQRATDGAGLGEGPLLILQSLDLDAASESRVVNEIFSAPSNSNMSSGHRAVADAMAPHFAPLKNYYQGYASGAPQIAGLKTAFNTGMKKNYSPTSFVVNTLLPADNDTRVFDYVATIVFVD